MGRRTLKIVLALILAVLVPSRAYASTLVGSYDIPQDADAVACDFLGYDYDTMDSGLRALLHSSTVGGGSGTDSNPNFAGYAAFRDSLYSPALMGDYQWYSRYDGFMFVDAVDQARSDVAGAVRWWDSYGGDDGGSGGSGGEVVDGAITLSKVFSVSNLSNPSSSVTITLTNSIINTLQSFQDKIVLITTDYYDGRNKTWVMRVFVSDNSINYTYTETNQYYGSYTVSGTDISYYYADVYPRGNESVTELSASGGLVSVSSGGSEFVFSPTSSFYASHSSGGGGSQPEGGPVPEPTPTQPAVPSGPTFSPTVNINTGSGGTVDLTPITERLDVMNQNFIDFAESFHEYWEWWGEMMADLDEQLQGYSSTIATWLQMIYERLSSLSSPNPSTQPTGWLDWLRALLAALVGDLPSAISGIQQSMSGLRNLFPFSIPWDLGILLGLFVSSPVTPVFDLPFAYSATNTAYIHIDCTQWNGVMSAVRSVELVAFAAALALRTRELIKGVEVE